MAWTGHPIGGNQPLIQGKTTERERGKSRTLGFGIRFGDIMAWLIVALLLFAGSIVAALLQSGGVSAALAIVAIAVAVASQLLSSRAPERRDEGRAETPEDDPRPANNER